MLRKIFLYFFCLCALPVLSQVDNDAPTDSVGLYRGIEGFAEKSKFTKWIHRLIFRPVPVITAKTIRKEQRKKPDPGYRPFERRVIRNIEIITLDPFGYKLKDTTVVPSTFLKRTGNVLHNKTAARTIRNLLLFERGDRFDSLKVRESERLIRSQKYIRDVYFICNRVGKSDSVDIYIRAMDVWSIIVEGSLTSSRFSPDLYERNFMGMGHKVEYQHNSYFEDGDYNMQFNYNIGNIYKSYVSTSVFHYRDRAGTRVSSVAAERGFYSPFTKWAGGGYLALQKSAPVYANEDSLEMLSVNSIQTDYWVGRSWRLFKGKTLGGNFANIITSFRYTDLHFMRTPDINDTLGIYSDEKFYLAGLGLSVRRYVSDRYVFKYGDGEDIPAGKAYGIVAGYRIRDNESEWYVGGKVSFGDYYSWGYFTTVLEYGSFINSRNFNQGVATIKIKYFTELMEAGNWKFRQFINPSLTFGMNRKSGENISINGEEGIQGFNSETLLGKKRLMFSLQTQSYAPWNILGFRFGPYIVINAALLTDEDENLFKSKVYTLFGLGLLIKNEYLVLNTFQLSLAFYPIIPDVGENIIKVNPLRTTNFSLWDFEFSRPAMSSYQ